VVRERGTLGRVPPPISLTKATSQSRNCPAMVTLQLDPLPNAATSAPLHGLSASHCSDQGQGGLGEASLNVPSIGQNAPRQKAGKSLCRCLCRSNHEARASPVQAPAFPERSTDCRPLPATHFPIFARNQHTQRRPVTRFATAVIDWITHLSLDVIKSH
jgi:hypothetical protein